MYKNENHEKMQIIDFCKIRKYVRCIRVYILEIFFPVLSQSTGDIYTYYLFNSTYKDLSFIEVSNKRYITALHFFVGTISLQMILF